MRSHVQSPVMEIKAVLTCLSSSPVPCVHTSDLCYHFPSIKRASPTPCHSSVLRRIILAFLFPTVFSLKLVSERYFDALRILGWVLIPSCFREATPVFLDHAVAEEAPVTTPVLVLVSQSPLLSSAWCCVLMLHTGLSFFNFVGEGLAVGVFGENGHYFLKIFPPHSPSFLSLGDSYTNEAAWVGPVAHQCSCDIHQGFLSGELWKALLLCPSAWLSVLCSGLPESLESLIVQSFLQEVGHDS